MKFGSFLSVARIAPLALMVAAFASGCTLTVKTKTRFVLPDGDPSTIATATDDWNGEAIELQAAGVQVSVNGGANIRGVAGLTKITVKARVLAMADDTDQASAQLSLAEAAKTLKISRGANGKFVIECGHGQSHGTSTADTSGCELLDIQVPTGSITQPVSITAAPATGSLTVTGLTVLDAQLTGDSDATVSLSFVKGATINVISSSGDASLSIPAASSADAVTLTGDATKSSSDFAEVKANAQPVSIGTVGEGAKSINVESKVFAGSPEAAILKKL